MERKDENVGTEAASHTAEAAKVSGKLLLETGRYSKKLTDSRKESMKGTETDQVSGKEQQKRKIKKEYQQFKHGEMKNRKNVAGSTMIRSAGERFSAMREQLVKYVSEHPQLVLGIIIAAMLLMIVSSVMSSCSVLMQGGSGAVIATTYTAEDAEIVGAEENYKQLEDQLGIEIERIEQDHPGFDEYRYELDEIRHDPYQLASFLTVLYEDYSVREVEETLERLFLMQYELSLEEEVEIRSRQETRIGIQTVTELVEDPLTGEIKEQTREEEYEYEVTVEYEYRILKVTLINHGLENVIVDHGGLDADQAERYDILNVTKGNKEYLF